MPDGLRRTPASPALRRPSDQRSPARAAGGSRPGTPPLRFFALLAIASLFLLGLAQAAWDLRLQILGTINTSDAAMSFIAGFTNDDGQANDPALDPGDTGNCPNGPRPDSSCDPINQGADPAPRLDRDVARCTAAVETGGLVATVELDGAYPAYRCTGWFAASNTGSLPLRIAGLRLNGTPVDLPSQTTADLNGDEEPDLELDISGLELCHQIDPGQQVTLVLGQQVLDGVPPNTELTFTVEVEFRQWNAECGADSQAAQVDEAAP